PGSAPPATAHRLPAGSGKSPVRCCRRAPMHTPWWPGRARCCSARRICCRCAAHRVRGEPDATPRARSPGSLEEVSWPWRRRWSCALPEPGVRLTLKRDARGPLDLDALPATLIIRARRGGERLRPLRGGRHRALKSLLQETHMPVAQRARLPLIFAAQRLSAVADLWLDESVQASAAIRPRARLLWSAA